MTENTPAAPRLSCRRTIDTIIHCSATPAGRDNSAADIRRWHLERGFSDIGYHFVVRLDGTIEAGRPLEQPGAHCRGHRDFAAKACPCFDATREYRHLTTE